MLWAFALPEGLWHLTSSFGVGRRNYPAAPVWFYAPAW